jgi:hypothetical protein
MCPGARTTPPSLPRCMLNDPHCWGKIHTCTRAHTHTCVHTHTLITHTYTHITHAFIHTHTYMHTITCMRAYTHTHMHIHTNMHAFTCTHTHTHTRTQHLERRPSRCPSSGEGRDFPAFHPTWHFVFANVLLCTGSQTALCVNNNGPIYWAKHCLMAFECTTFIVYSS